MLSLLPSVDRLLSHPLLEAASPALRIEACREAIAYLRECVANADTDSFTKETLYDLAGAEAARLLAEKTKASLRPVVNATGIVLHTNLGRAPLSEKALRSAMQIGVSYSTLEFDLETGQRGTRQAHTDRLLCRLTGAAASLCVNNNAAAVFLSLNSLAKGKEVIISRGQLIEIGDTFRIPEIINLSGAVIVETGTTNRTRLSDYENAISEDTAFIMYVHPANFSMTGFTQSTSIAELCELGAKKNIPVIADLGSGCMYRFPDGGQTNEPLVADAVQAGCSLVTFSGDKLLGGPQAGIIAGKKNLVDRIRKNPLHRVVRIDKLSLAALEATLSEYLDPVSAREHIPTLNMLTATPDMLSGRAETLCRAVSGLPGFDAETQMGFSPVGGGSMPDSKLETRLVMVSHSNHSANALAKHLRHSDPPVIAFIHDDRLAFDVRTIRDSEIGFIVSGFTGISVDL